MNEAEYYADPCPEPSLSYSVAKVLLEQSPHHAWMCHPRLNPNYRSDESARFDLGTAAHDLLLEGGTAKICVIDPQEHRSKPTKADPEGKVPTGWTNGAMRDARDLARSNGLVPVLPWDNAKLRVMVETAQDFISRSELAGIFEGGSPEHVITWQEGGEVPQSKLNRFAPELRAGVIARNKTIWCRSRLDLLSEDRRVILDYKTCQSAEPEAFIRQIARMRYDLQAAFYSHGVAMQTYPLDNPLFEAPTFVFLAQEIEPPYACSLTSLSNAYMDMARDGYHRAVKLWRECLNNHKWPAYTAQIHYAEPPTWALNEFMENQENELSI